MEPGGSALIQFLTFGGATMQSVGHAELVGLARNDISRVVASLANGTEQELPLNEWRGFDYVSGTADTLPTALVAYGADGSKRDTINFAVAPVCGGTVGRCPSLAH
jgi:hypothetical protein